MSTYTLKSFVFFRLEDAGGEVIECPIWITDPHVEFQTVEFEAEESELWAKMIEIAEYIQSGYYGGGYGAGEHMMNDMFANDLPRIKSVE